MHAATQTQPSLDRSAPREARPVASLLWLAAADARGHLMRAHLVRAALARRGVAVHVVTTSDAGRAFLAALGTPSRTLSSHYAIEFDAHQDLDRARTEARLARYFVAPDRALHDAATLRRLAQGADLLVNDFHPLPLVLPRHLGAPVVHVYGTHLWDAIAHHLAGRAPAAIDRSVAAAAVALRARAFGCLEHSLARRPGDARVLPPVVAAPSRSRAAVRASLGAASGTTRLAAVYLNPHFRDPRLAAAIEAALDRAGFVMHAVGEGFAHRPRWRACDPGFNDVAAAADVLVSAPGMGALAAWQHFGTPLLALVSDQPEQAANAADLARARAAPYAVLSAATLEPGALAAALDALTCVPRGPRPDPQRVARAVHEQWADALVALVAQASQSHRR